jgi:hypothetical protein
MGATIFYRQVKPQDNTSLGVDAPSSFIEAMEKAFGDKPWRLTEEDVQVLKGMAAVYDGYSEHPFKDLIKAVERLGVVEVWPEW